MDNKTKTNISFLAEKVEGAKRLLKGDRVRFSVAYDCKNVRYAVNLSVLEKCTANRLQGIVTSYNEKKQFGFIEISGKKETIFFHLSNFEDFLTLQKDKAFVSKTKLGMELEFNQVRDEADASRWCAIRIRLLAPGVLTFPRLEGTVEFHTKHNHAKDGPLGAIRYGDGKSSD
jgi:cold shock CspA family protein